MIKKISFLLLSLYTLTSCSLFETTTPVAVVTPTPEPRDLMLAALQNAGTVPTGRFVLSGKVNLKSITNDDSIQVTTNGTFSNIINALRAQGSVSVTLPGSTGEPTQGLLTTDFALGNQRALIRMVSAQFAGSNSAQVNSDISTLNNIWIHIAALDQAWPPQDLLQRLFPRSNEPWQDFLTTLEIVDQSRVQLSDHQATRIVATLKKDELWNQIKSNIPATDLTLLQPLLNLATWQGEFLIHSDTNQLESFSGTITIPGQYNNDTTLKIDYQVTITPDSEAKTILPTPTETLEFAQLFSTQ
ncbi:hypothetical protein KA517_02495 [Candidatus Gracilibacteria bacterium]|nr:hypothetical protein [Candidatus Gracilibacteria bacterium]